MSTQTPSRTGRSHAPPGHPAPGGRLMLEAVSSGLKTDAERAERREVDAKRANRVEEDLEAFRNVLERFLANTA